MSAASKIVFQSEPLSDKTAALAAAEAFHAEFYEA